MEGRVIDHGQYELHESERGRTMLILNEANAYSWTKVKAIERLRLVEGMNEKSGDRHFKIVYEGPYFVLNLEDNSQYHGLPHLYLKTLNHYEEFIIQDGFPDLINQEKEIVRTNRIIPAEEIETFAYQKY